MNIKNNFFLYTSISLISIMFFTLISCGDDNEVHNPERPSVTILDDQSWELNKVEMYSENLGFIHGFDNQEETPLVYQFDGTAFNRNTYLQSLYKDGEFVLKDFVFIDDTHYQIAGYGFYSHQEGFLTKGLLFNHSASGWTIDEEIYHGISGTGATIDWQIWSIDYHNDFYGYAVGYDLENASALILRFDNNIWDRNLILEHKDTEITDVDYLSDIKAITIGTEHIEQTNNTRGAIFYSQLDTWLYVDNLSVASDKWGLYEADYYDSSNGFAVGYDDQSGHGVMAQYKNDSWSIIDPQINVADVWEYTSISVFNSNFGIAIGNKYTDNLNVTAGIITLWDGNNWNISSNFPAISDNYKLTSVSIASESKAFITGIDYSSGIELAEGFVVEYDGSSWKKLDFTK